MIQYPKNPVQLQKELPKKLTHIKEEAKIRFIQTCMELYRTTTDFGWIQFDDSLYDGKSWVIQYDNADVTLSDIVEQIMEKWYFSNLSKNENVYFYRFINVFRSLMTDNEWQETEKQLCNSRNSFLKENIMVYCDYRNKLDEIDIMLEQKTNIRESI